METTVEPPKRKNNYPPRFDKGGLARSPVTSAQMAKLAIASVPSAAEARAMLFAIRKTHGLARGHLAAILHVPIGSLSNWEQGRKAASCLARHRISEVYHELCGG